MKYFYHKTEQRRKKKQYNILYIDEKTNITYNWAEKSKQENMLITVNYAFIVSFV